MKFFEKFGYQETRIGIDLDNTLIDYSRAYIEIGKRFGFGQEETRESIRNKIKSDDGKDILWQEIQSLLYTEGLEFALPSLFSLDFLDFCLSNSCEINIVSHKTCRTQERFGSVDLREPAIKWLRKHNLIPARFQLNSVKFAQTKSEKVSMIIASDYDLFIDDLPEIVEELNLSKKLECWRFLPESNGTLQGDFRHFRDSLLQRSWKT